MKLPSKISQTATEQIVKLLLEKSEKNIKKKKEDLGEFIRSILISTLPLKLRDTFLEYPEYFKLTSSVYLNKNLFDLISQMSVDIKPLPSMYNDHYSQKLIDLGFKEKIVDMVFEIQKMQSEDKKVRIELNAYINGLSTFFRLKTFFPEAYNLYVESLPKATESVNQSEQLMAPSTNLLKKIETLNN